MSDGKYHRVRAGQGCWDLAVDNGLTLEKVWQHAENSELKSRRKNPNVLQPGDMLFIPELEQKEVLVGTEQTHRFVRKSIPFKIRLRFLQEGQPRADEPWALHVDGIEKSSGKTDGDGVASISLIPGYQDVTIKVGKDDDAEVYQLDVGQLNPISELSGVQQRLLNLGFSCEVNGKSNPGYHSALKSFQKKHNLSVTGELTEETRSKLLEVHGS